MEAGAGFVAMYHNGKIRIAYNARHGIVRFYRGDSCILELTDRDYSNVYQVLVGLAGEYLLAEQGRYYRQTNYRYFTVNKRRRRRKHRRSNNGACAKRTDRR